ELEVEMIETLVRVAVGFEHAKTLRADEGQRRDGVLHGIADRVVREKVSAKRDRRGVGIIELDEVRGRRRKLAREPFVDLYLVRIAKRLHHVRGAEARDGEHEFAGVADAADGEVGQLQTER